MHQTGGCFCKSIRYELTGEPLAVIACYCRDCQMSSGGPASHLLTMPKSAVRVKGGMAAAYRSTGESGRAVSRWFCPTCGTPLFAENEALVDCLSVRIGTLDDSGWVRSFIDIKGINIWTSSAPDWALPDRRLADFARNPF